MREIDGFDGQATARIGLQLLAILAQRSCEIRNAKWVEIDFASKIWAILAEKMKVRRTSYGPAAQPSDCPAGRTAAYERERRIPVPVLTLQNMVESTLIAEKVGDAG